MTITRASAPYSEARWNQLVDQLTRRDFMIGSASLAALLSACSVQQGDSDQGASATRTVTTALGTYDIPLEPRRVIAIDSRLDLEPAVSLQLPLVGYSYSEAERWVPVEGDLEVLTSPVNLEEVAALQPDLIICTDLGTEDPQWPREALMQIAPVLPLDFTLPWRESLTQLIGWLGISDTGKARAATAEYESKLEDIRGRHRRGLAEHKIALINYGSGGANGTAPSGIAAQVAHDLGIELYRPVEGKDPISPERYDLLAPADGLLVTTAVDGAPDRGTDVLWGEIPAVAAGAVIYSNGNVNFGSVYTASYCLDLFDDLLTRLNARGVNG
ncbi:ABC transporter substrate-binding protein [Hoyosella altamirensis]|uniref:Iron complex transport system substrate-binding protein n=1 Tax=Hoyosella altamirensis TaxID=616997 RepID=A0A839RLX6_9ACTN|nr:ABC transporter substrate-binding protein [Hoyosella altamirensis]MBB3037033.1 iron complex transport system substrate-binding protein [Hoyosella altamirensis]